MIKFQEESHRYQSIVPDNRNWKGVTTLLKKYKEEFPGEERSLSCSMDPTSKWYGLQPAEIKGIWKGEGDRSTVLGKWYHGIREAALCCKNMSPVVDGWKHALPQVLYPGIYPEFLMYHPDYNICGQADKVEVTGDKILVNDYKTSKKISKSGFRGKKMLYPLHHIDECELSSYTLQLSMYAWILKFHNPALQVGKLTIEHIKFVLQGLDKWEYPIYATDGNGDYIVEDIKLIEVPYMEKEIRSIIEHEEATNKIKDQETYQGTTVPS